MQVDILEKFWRQTIYRRTIYRRGYKTCIDITRAKDVHR